MNKLVVFDLDGTLNQTDLFAVPAHQKALAQFGVTDKTDSFIRSTFGARSHDYVRMLLGECDAQTARDYLNKVAQYETELIATNGKPFDGVPVLLSRLKQEGYTIAVCSNASARYINMVLASLNLAHFIDHVQELYPNMIKEQTLSILLEKRQPERAVMVGDRIFDHEAAQANNLPFIGCLYGFNPEEMAQADIAVSTVSEIYEAIRQLIG